MRLFMPKSHSIALVLALTLLPLVGQTATKPSYDKADQNGDGTVTVQEAKKVGVSVEEAKDEDLDDNGKLTKTDWRFVDLTPQKGSE